MDHVRYFVITNRPEKTKICHSAMETLKKFNIFSNIEQNVNVFKLK